MCRPRAWCSPAPSCRRWRTIPTSSRALTRGRTAAPASTPAARNRRILSRCGAWASWRECCDGAALDEDRPWTPRRPPGRGGRGVLSRHQPAGAARFLARRGRAAAADGGGRWAGLDGAASPALVGGHAPPARPQLRPGLPRSEEHTSELQSRSDLVCRLLLEKKQKKLYHTIHLKKKTKNTY